MSETLAASIKNAQPSDNELRFGTISNVSPITVLIQGQPVFAGRLGSYIPVAGDTVAVLRQDATWLVLGSTSTTDKQVSTILAAQSSAILQLTTTVTDVPSCTVTLVPVTNSAVAAVQWTGDFESTGTTATTGVCAVWLNGVMVGSPQAIFNNMGINGARATVGNQMLLPLGTGTQTITLRGNRASGADLMLRLNSLHTNLLVTVYE